MKRVLKAFVLTLIIILTFSITVLAETDDNFGGEDGRSGNVFKPLSKYKQQSR